MYVRVIVDIPAREVSRPFDYAVPERFKPLIAIGCRVAVPFGARTVQGFVVEIAHHSDQEPDKIKPIEQLLDLVPPLTPELIQLSEWISTKYICSRVVALQAMLPAALKAKYERVVTVADSKRIADLERIAGPEHFADLEQIAGPKHSARLESAAALEHGDERQLDNIKREIVHYVDRLGQIETDRLLRRYPDYANVVKQLIEDGVLSESRVVRDRIGKKKQLFVIPLDRVRMEEVLASLDQRAHKQRELLKHLIEHPEPMPLAELTSAFGTGTGTVRALAAKRAIRIEVKEMMRDPYENRRFTASEPLRLTPDQEAALRAVEQSVRNRQFQRFLLHGVTGSGKTEVYLQAIRACMDTGRDSIVLVPEISLTPQMVERFKGRFGDRVAVLHSRLSSGERYDEWRKIHEGIAQVAIGARSAVFAPFRNLGLIIIDEEHESSYKQEDPPKYHARDIAFARGKYHGAAVVLGSATPSLESFSSAGSSLTYLHMPGRVGDRPLPTVDVVDMREELKAGNRSMFSRKLFESLQETMARGEQTVLLLNRRGHSTFVMCRSCGYVAECPHCEIALTYHRASRNVRCHYCGYARPEIRTCPDCGSEHIRYFGTGTQKVEEELARQLPGIRVIRMDVDTTTEKGAHEKWLNRFRNGQADVLLGTQMVAKGLDFPKVTLVGVIAADTVLHLPDFRAAERTFQLLTQVAGRAGRHELPGRVVIQTYNPEHYSIVHASRHDYIPFAREELRHRKKRVYPPYCSLALVTFMHEQTQILISAGEQFAHTLKSEWYRSYPDRSHILLEVLGPVASPVPRRKDRYRFQCVVKYRKDTRIPEVIRRAVDETAKRYRNERLQITVDVDPQVMM